MKQGQIVVYLIIVLLIVVAALIIVLPRTIPTQKNAILPDSERDAYEIVIQQCLERTARNGIILSGLHGGYITAPPFLPETQVDGVRVSYGYYQEVSVFPSKELFQNEIADFVLYNLKDCLESEGKSSISGTINLVEARVQNESVEFRLVYPASYATSRGVIQLGPVFQSDIPSSMGNLLNAGTKFVQAYSNDPEYLDLDVIHNFRLNGVSTKITPIKPATLLIRFMSMNDKPELFQFLVTIPEAHE